MQRTDSSFKRMVGRFLNFFVPLLDALRWIFQVVYRRFSQQRRQSTSEQILPAERDVRVEPVETVRKDSRTEAVQQSVPVQEQVSVPERIPGAQQVETIPSSNSDSIPPSTREEDQEKKAATWPGWVEVPDEPLPQPTYWPVVMALGIVLFVFGFLTTIFISGLGAILFFISLGGWIGEMWNEQPETPES
ncbi:MAG TPA: hypothetical protein VH186_13520 [Chloroflexia bacterium]|nr:hypothetical protein [Chloroflexia bacterium]